MRIMYFIISSSLMVCFMLLFRQVFRKKLSAGAMYALWLIPFFRLLVPFGFIETPVFGTAAEIIYRPMAIAEQFFEEEKSENLDVYEETVNNTNVITNINPSTESVKIYDTVIPENTIPSQVKEPVESNTATNVMKKNQITFKEILLSIWFAGSVIVAGYVIVENRKLRKKVNAMDVVWQIDGVDICISKDIKTPCLFGLRNPKIIATEEVMADATLYEYAITHELEHYHHKDHIYNANKIGICILYWWNPLIWYAAKCVSEDAELACDERVLKNKSIEERKNYGYALLKMIENAKNKPLCMATSFSGDKNFMKQRIEAIARKRHTKKYIIFPMMLLLVSMLMVGCFYPSESSWLQTLDRIEEDDDLWIYTESKYQYSLQKNIKSHIIYYDIYEYGKLVDRSILGAGIVEDYTGTLKLRRGISKKDEEDKFIIETDGVGIEIPSPLNEYATNFGKSSSALHSDDKIEIIAEKNLIVSADYKTNDGTTQTYNCLVISDYTDDELKELLRDDYVVGLCRVVFSEKSLEELYEKYDRENKNSDWSQLADSWARAFIDKDVEIIKKLATEKVCQQLIDDAILDEESTSFGWSSPWPVFAEEHYRIAYCDSKGAEIIYYAVDSTPHVYVWKEKLQFSNIENETKVCSWSLERYDVISELDEYRNAYPRNQIVNTPMDYFTNGLGEALNKNALLSSSEIYKPLFEAGSAALELLNINKDYSLVRYNTEESEQETIVHIWFLNEDGSTDGTSVAMWQPYGNDGIWIPGEKVTETTELHESEIDFYMEPEKDKVCLAVMPDGISKAGGDYRYIIPEDQVEWVEQYKQARSLAVNGAWKDGERSAGIWLVLNDEWTCITQQGMIFDFEKRVEKEKIEDFYNLCLEEALKYGTGTPIKPEYFPKIVSATLEYNGKYTVTDANFLSDLQKIIFTSKEIRGGAACPFTASLTLELENERNETIYLATDSCAVWLSDGVYFEYFGYQDIEEVYELFKKYAVESPINQTLGGNHSNADYLIKNAEENLRDDYKEAKLTYVDNAEVGWNYYDDNPWESNAERDALAQAALKELYTLTGYNVEECTYTTNGRSLFVFGKSASNIKKSIAFYSRDYGFTLYGESTPYMGYVNARRVHYSDVQQLDSPYHKKEYSGHAAIPTWFLEQSGVYRGEKITGFDAINLDDTVYTHIKLNFDGGYYLVIMDEKIESVQEVSGPYRNG